MRSKACLSNKIITIFFLQITDSPITKIASSCGRQIMQRTQSKIHPDCSFGEITLFEITNCSRRRLGSTSLRLKSVLSVSLSLGIISAAVIAKSSDKIEYCSTLQSNLRDFHSELHNFSSFFSFLSF